MGRTFFCRALRGAFDFEIDGMRLRRCLTRSLRGIQILHIPDLHHAVHDHLRRFFVANGNAAIQDNRRVFIKQRPYWLRIVENVRSSMEPVSSSTVT